MIAAGTPPAVEVAYQPGQAPASTAGMGGWWVFVAIALIALLSVLGPFAIRVRRRRSVVRGLIRALHTEVAAALADPVLIHQARRTVSSWRADGLSTPQRPQENGPPRPP